VSGTVGGVDEPGADWEVQPGRTAVTIRRVVPHLHTGDGPASRDFYAGFLGFEVAMDLGWIVTLASPSNPTAQVNLYGEATPSASLQPLLSVEVDDVDAIHAEAVRRGIDIVRPLTDESWGVRRFFARDPDGNVVNILSHAGDAEPTGEG